LYAVDRELCKRIAADSIELELEELYVLIAAERQRRTLFA